ncbi:MAG TPA: hypothetical protein VFH06_00590 [Candidatus Saccharimonadales bacterium]|nr:hypothetical protein [Candidatus Saccharimonadales bacterium]
MESRIALDDTQSRIVKWLGDGYDNEAIAAKMSIPVADVELHIKELSDLFGVDTPAGIVGKSLAHKCISVYDFSPLPLSK